MRLLNVQEGSLEQAAGRSEGTRCCIIRTTIHTLIMPVWLRHIPNPDHQADVSHWCQQTTLNGLTSLHPYNKNRRSWKRRGFFLKIFPRTLDGSTLNINHGGAHDFATRTLHKNVGNGLLDQAELSCATLANGYTSKLTRDPFSARWTTKDEDCADVEESAENSSAHWMVRLSG